MIRITSRNDKFRRCGVAHPKGPVDHPDGRFTADELAVLRAEPMLTVVDVPDPEPRSPSRPSRLKPRRARARAKRSKPMSYATEQDIINRYSEDELLMAFDRDGDLAVDQDGEGASIALAALADASAEIDGYLAGRYTLPLEIPRPGFLTLYCVDIALYKGSLVTEVTEEKRKRYEDAIRFLRSVAKGEIQLFASDPSAPEGGTGASFSADDRIFTRDTMRGMR